MPPGKKMWITDFAGGSLALLVVVSDQASRRKKFSRVNPRPPRKPTCINDRRVGRQKWAGSSCQVPVIVDCIARPLLCPGQVLEGVGIYGEVSGAPSAGVQRRVLGAANEAGINSTLGFTCWKAGAHPSTVTVEQRPWSVNSFPNALHFACRNQQRAGKPIFGRKPANGGSAISAVGLGGRSHSAPCGTGGRHRLLRKNQTPAYQVDQAGSDTQDDRDRKERVLFQ